MHATISVATLLLLILLTFTPQSLKSEQQDNSTAVITVHYTLDYMVSGLRPTPRIRKRTRRFGKWIRSRRQVIVWGGTS